MRFMGIVGRLAFAAFLLSLIIGIVASFGTRFHLWDFQVGLLRIFPFCLYFGFAGFVFGAIWAVGGLFMNSGTGARYGVVGLVGSIAALAVPVYDICMIKIVHAIPPIHDISTDTEHPPLFLTLLHDRPGTLNPPDYEGNKVIKAEDGTSSTGVALQKKYYSDLRPAEDLTTPAKLYDRALTAANAMGWDIVSAMREPNGGHIEATDTAFFFGFADDIVIRVEPSGMGARLDVRSKSRVDDISDLGRNAARIRAYMKKLAGG